MRTSQTIKVSGTRSKDDRQSRPAELNAASAPTKSGLVLNGDSAYGRLVSAAAAIQIQPLSAFLSEQEFAGSERVLLISQSRMVLHDPASPVMTDSDTLQFAASSMSAFNINIEAPIRNTEPLRADQSGGAIKINTVAEVSSMAHQLNTDINQIIDFPSYQKPTDYSSLAQHAASSDVEARPKVRTSVTESANVSQGDFFKSHLRSKFPEQASKVNLGSTLQDMTKDFTDLSQLTNLANVKNTAGDTGINAPDTLISSVTTKLNAKFMPYIENIIYTGSGNAVLTGNNNSNVLIGSTGYDILSGGRGDDKLIGGEGSDVFIFTRDDGANQILDFSIGDHLAFKGANSLSEITSLTENGIQIISFGDTTVELIGMENIALSNEWIDLIR